VVRRRVLLVDRLDDLLAEALDLLVRLLERRPRRHPEAEREVVHAVLLVVALELLDALLRRAHHQVVRALLGGDVVLGAELGMAGEDPLPVVELPLLDEVRAELLCGLLERVRDPAVAHEDDERLLAALLRRLLVGRDALVPDLLEDRRGVGGHRLPVGRGALDRLGARVAAAPDRPAAFLVRPGREEALLDLPVLAVEVEPLALERLLPDLDRLEEPAEELLLRDPELAPVAGVVAAGHRRVEPPLGEVVDDRELLRGAHRVVERRHVRERPDRDLVGLAREDREELLRAGEVALGPAVAVRNLDRVEPRALGDDPFLDHQVERAMGVVGARQGLVVPALVDVDQVSDPHGPSFGRGVRGGCSKRS
jgi:hypothetical protein